MAHARLSKGQVAIPEELRRALDLDEGDVLEARLVAGGLFLRRAVSSRDSERDAWAELLALIDRPKGEAPADPRAQEEEIAEQIKAMRRAHG